MTDPSTAVPLDLEGITALIKQWRANARWMRDSPDRWHHGGCQYVRQCADQLEAEVARLSAQPALDIQALYDNCGITFATYEARTTEQGVNAVRCRLCGYGNGEPHVGNCGVGVFEAALARLSAVRRESTVENEDDQARVDGDLLRARARSTANISTGDK